VKNARTARSATRRQAGTFGLAPRSATRLPYPHAPLLTLPRGP